jgi:flagellar biosynthesis GTPase FlhF
VYQLSAQFPGPTSPREFITLLITSDNCLTEASKVGTAIPRHFMVVSIPVSHPDAPPRNGMVRGFYESIEMIREIPLESTGDGDNDAETNPVEWIMVTRSDPGGGIPRFMVERNVPSSIVNDAIKFLDWACAKNDAPDAEGTINVDTNGIPTTTHEAERHLSIAESNGIMAGIGTSIADRPSPSVRRLSQRVENESSEAPRGLLEQARDMVGSYLPDAFNPLQRTASSSSASTVSSVGSFASAEQFNTAEEGVLNTASSSSLHPEDSIHARELQKIEDRKKQIQEQFDQAREKQEKDLQNDSEKTQKEIEKAAEKHSRERKKQEEKFAREIQKLEERREKEAKKLLERQRKEADKNQVLKAQRERDEYKQKADILEQENKLLKEQIGNLQKENTAIVAKLGRTDIGREILSTVREETMSGRKRASSRASASSGRSGKKSVVESTGKSSTQNSLS